MSALPNLFFDLIGRTTGDLVSTTLVPARPVGPVRVTMGLAGDTVSVTVKRFTDAGAEAWPPADWDVSKDIAIRFGVAGEAGAIEIGGLRLTRVDPVTFGVSVPDHGMAGEAVHNELQLTLVSRLAYLRDGRGGRITEGTWNHVDEHGAVKVDANWHAPADIVSTLCVSMLLSFDASSLIGVDIPDVGPLDFGNARAIDELEAYLGIIGFGAALTLDGRTLRMFRLPRTGEPMTLPDPLEYDIEPFALGQANPIRAARILVTSGRTRTTVVAERLGSQVEFVAFDARTGQSGKWGGITFWTTEYPTEIGPWGIDDYRAGPPRDEPRRSQYRRLYGAVRISDAADWAKTRHMVPLPITVRDADEALVNGAAIVLAKACIPHGANQLRNQPESAVAGVLQRFDGARVHAPDGVIEMPGNVEFVRMSPGPTGTREHAVQIEPADFRIIFAHESHTGDRLLDYYWRGFNVSIVEGALTLTPVAEDVDIEAMIDDPQTLAIEAPQFQLVQDEPAGAMERTDINRTVLDALALPLAEAHAAAGLLASGVIELRGLEEITPGDFGGIVTSVEWDVRGLRTLLTINGHDLPQGIMDEIAAQARRSYAAGLGRFSLPGSSAGMSDTRGGSTPGHANVAGSGGGDSVTVFHRAGLRGAEDRVATPRVIESPVPPAPRAIDQTLLIRITASTLITANKWRYEWQSVAATDTPLAFSEATAARTHASDGYAYNMREAGNIATGVQGNGVNVDDLPEGWALQPIAPETVHEARVGFGASGARFVYFSANNGTDGMCAEEPPPP